VKPALRTAITDDEDHSLWRRLRRNVSIGLFGSGFSIAIKLAQTILLTTFLRIDDYGRVLIVLNLFVFLDSVFGLRVSDVMFRFYQQFREQENARALSSLLKFCSGVCLLTGLLIYLGVVVLSPWLAARFYSTPALSMLFKIYGLTVIVSAFSGVYEPVLRLYDRFAAIVVPQVLGSLATLVILFTYFMSTNGVGYDLRVVMIVLAIGALLQSVPPLLKAWYVVRPVLAGGAAHERSTLPANFRHDLVRCLFNSNLSGYLKFVINPGDVFLLGVFASPTQVALYGLAKQLTAPLALLQTTIQTAVAPEITNLIAKLKLQQLLRLVRRYVTATVIFGALLFLSALLLGRFLIMHFFSIQYLTALPVFYCLLLTAWLLLIFLVFRPIALSFDLIKWHNLALLLSAAVAVWLIVAGSLNAMTIAYVQLGEAVLLRLSFSLLVWNKLRARSKAATSEK
jgi:O-antigen/teichoic acid export membrane protein